MAFGKNGNKRFAEMEVMRMKKEDPNGWFGLEGAEGYLDFPRQDCSQIAVSIFEHNVPVKLHRHRYYEFSLVSKGCCFHEYRGVVTPLITGDVFMIEPGEYHGYYVQTPMQLINCQFFSGDLTDKENDSLLKSEDASVRKQGDATWKERWNEIVKYNMMHTLSLEEERSIRERELSVQGVIHLDIQERKEIEYLLQRMMKEQEEQDIGLTYMKSAYLQQILVSFQRIQNRKLVLLKNYRDSKREYIYQVIGYMEEHLEEKLDLQGLAQKAYWSEGYFRKVFKDITGMSPIGYFNRMRILKSLEIRTHENLNFCEAAARVGIYDASYYNRLFKKEMGSSPRSFMEKAET